MELVLLGLVVLMFERVVKRNKLCCLNIKFFYYLPNGFR
nr:MAG TPA: hypothetical protein [Crassvirales sp.]